MCLPLGERPDRPGGSAGREDPRPGNVPAGTSAEIVLHRGDAATGTHPHTHTHTGHDQVF